MVRWLFVIAACGPRVVGDEGGSTSSGSTTGADTSSESSGFAAVCEEFADALEETTPVTIEIANVGKQPILLDAPCSTPDYLELTTRSGWYWPGAHCATTCEEQFEYGCNACGPCYSAAYTVVMPGGVATVEWSGQMFLDVAPPTECFASDTCGETCPQRRVGGSEPVDVILNAIGFEDCVANEPDPAACDCGDSERTVCETLGMAHIEPTQRAATIYEPGAAGPIVVQIYG